MVFPFNGIINILKDSNEFLYSEDLHVNKIWMKMTNRMNNIKIWLKMTNRMNSIMFWIGLLYKLKMTQC